MYSYGEKPQEKELKYQLQQMSESFILCDLRKTANMRHLL